MSTNNTHWIQWETKKFKTFFNLKGLCCLIGLRDAEGLWRILELDLETCSEKILPWGEPWSFSKLRIHLEELFRINIFNRWLHSPRASRITLFCYVLCPLTVRLAGGHSSPGSVLNPLIRISQDYKWTHYILIVKSCSDPRNSPDSTWTLIKWQAWGAWDWFNKFWLVIFSDVKFQAELHS